MRSLLRSLLVASCVVLALGSGATGCSDDVAPATLAQGCVLNSDCAGGLVCSLGRCHVVCRTSKDCDAGARCVSANGKNVCLLDKESTCASKEPCTEPLICAADLKCRSGCTSAADCPAEQVCAHGGICADKGEVDSVGNLLGAPLPDAGGSGGSGTGGAPATGGGVGTGGTSSTGGAPEAGLDATFEASVPEASTPSDASVDSSSGCQSDSQCPLATPTCVAGKCLPDTVLLVAAPTSTTSQSIGASFDGTAWTATDIGNDIFGGGGGGVAVMPDGRGMAVLRGNQSPRFRSASYTGAAWTQLADGDGQLENYAGMPIASPTGFLEAHIGIGQLQLATHSVASGWSPLREIASASASVTSPPAVVETPAGDPLLLFENGTDYEFTVRSAGTWSNPVAIPGATTPTDTFRQPSIAGVRYRSGVVALFLTGGTSSTTVHYSVWSAGAWSTAALAGGGASTRHGIAATVLRDGRVALAYVGANNSLQIGFFDGGVWSAFKSVPGAVVAGYAHPLGIARGAHRTAALEVAFIDSASVIRHTRLSDEANWTWTPAVGISTSRTYGLVSIATGP